MEQNETPKPRKRRKVLWILLIVLAVLIAALVAVGIWQKNNIEAVTQFTQYTQEELENQLKLNDQYVKDLLDQALNNAGQVDQNHNAGTAVQPGTTAAPAQPEPVQTTTAASHQTTAAQTTAVPGTAKAPVVGTAKPSQTTSAASAVQKATTAATTSAATKAPSSGPTYEEQLKAIVDKVYALRQEYLTALENLQSEAVKEYKALSAGQKTTKALMSFVSKFISKGTSLERECDKKMDALVAELTALQKKYNQSLDLVDAVKYTYAQEKSLKKAWYMSELESRGLI